MQELIYDTYNFTDINKIGIGIENCGNSCFFNSTIQLLFHIPELREFLIINQSNIDNIYLKNLIKIFELSSKNQVINRDTQLYNQTLKDFYNSIQELFFMDPVQRAYDNAILEIKSNTKLSSAEIERIRTKAETNLRENLLHNSAQRDANELLRKFLNLITEEIIAKLYIFNDFPNFTKQLLIDLNILLPFIRIVLFAF